MKLIAAVHEKPVAAVARDLIEHHELHEGRPAMAVSTHTPGPWRHVDTNARHSNRAVWRYRIRMPEHSNRLKHGYEEMADARLIAAAPTLWTPCSRSHGQQTAVGNSPTLPASPALFESIRDMARAAIAKAEGRSD